MLCTHTACLMEFRGPSNPKAWTGSSVPDSTCRMHKLLKADALLELPAHCAEWHEYDLGEGIDLRSNPGVTIPTWASMGYWRKNNFGLLMALAARLPDFSIVVLHDGGAGGGEGEVEFAVVVDRGGKRFHALGHGLSKKKAKESAAIAAMKAMDLAKWLRDTHAKTLCDEHLDDV